MGHFKRCVLLATCLPLIGCASTQSSWWGHKEAQGQPGQDWTKRYTTHSFSRNHNNVQRDATNQLKKWAEWKCPIAGYDTREVRVVETSPPPPGHGLLSLYYGNGLGIRQSMSMEMDITCRNPHALAENTVIPDKQ